MKTGFYGEAVKKGAVALLVIGMIMACGGGDGGGGRSTGITVPKVGDLPAFPAEPNPATTEEGVLSILEELAGAGARPWPADQECSVAQEVYLRMRNVVYANEEETDYNKKDLEDSRKTVKVSASYKKANNEERMKGIVTNKIEKDNVSVAKGSTIEQLRYNTYASFSTQCVLGFTAITTAGSVKIIFYFTAIGTWSGSDLTEKFSGSLQVFGKDDKLLLSKPINDVDTYYDTQEMIGIRIED
jgi:hypothetical protein